MSIWDQFSRHEPVDVAGTPFADPQGYWSRLWTGQQTGPQVRDPQAMRTDPWVWSGGGTAARTSDLAWDEALMSPGARKAAEVMSSEPASRLMMLANFLGPKAPLPAPKGIRAFHGSPHDFDRFDLSKIGTGEGAQAYGRGLYFAESEPVARSYRDSLSGKINIHDRRDLDQAWINAAASMHKENYPADQIAGMLRSAYKLTDEKKIADVIQAAHPGRMYEVNIKADPADFLDWDVPLSQQSEKVRAAMEAIGMPLDKSGKDAFFGLNYHAGRQHGASRPTAVPTNPEKASEMLREAGLAGIRYKDAGSRDGPGGTSNYVVFSDDLIEILRKYGLAGILAGGASLATPSQGDAAQ